MLKPKLYFLIVVFMLPIISAASEICWIDHVSREGDELHLYFKSRSFIMALVENEAGNEIVRYRVWESRVQAEDGNFSDYLVVLKSQTILLIQSPEDRCSLRVVEGARESGIVARAVNSLPGLEHAEVSSFITVRD